MIDVARQAVEAARAAGASYADARVVSEEGESLTVRNQEMEGVDRSFSQGLGIRVLVDGYWGFAATARTEDGEIDATAALAVDIARAASRLPMEPVRLAESEPVTAAWETRVQEDPFLVDLDEKVALLMEASRLRAVGEGRRLRRGDDRPLPAPHVLRVQRGLGHSADDRALRRRHRGHRDR